MGRPVSGGTDPVAADDPGCEGEGLTGQRQCGTAEKQLVHDPGFDAYGFVPLVFRIPSFPLTRAGAQPEEGTINITIANPAGQRRLTADLGRSEG